MVTIIQPKSVYVDNSNANTYTLTWKQETPTVEGYTVNQYAFEVLYRVKGNTSWSTTGKISSTATSYDLRKLHEYLGTDLDEIQYQLYVYYSGTYENDTYTYTDSSLKYSLVFNQGYSYTLKVFDGENTLEYPLFDNVNNSNIDITNINVDSSTKKLPLVPQDHPLGGGTHQYQWWREELCLKVC
jgi:hypothetical protein